MKAKILKIKIEEIKIEDSPQVRVSNNADALVEYAEMFKKGKKLPPVVVFGKGGTYYLADGFHRVEAAKNAGKQEIDADIRRGERKDALKFALSANTEHGVRRTNADKRNAVRMALAEFPDYSNNRIGDELCRVSDDLVAGVRREVQAEAAAEAAAKAKKDAAKGKATDENTAPKQPEKVIGKDDKHYSATRKPTGIPAAQWTNNDPVVEPSVPPVADSASTFDDIVAAIRELTGQVEPADADRLADVLRKLADEVASRKGETVVAA
jgi:ParB-like chromosome segregation protein Spo0J